MLIRQPIRPLVRDLVRQPTVRRGGGFSPASLFAAGEQGFWYDPSDLSTQFQDSAGTTPVTAAGQPVGKVLDKSGRGNHLVQATTTSRPILQQDGSGFWHWVLDGTDDSLSTAATANFSASDKIAVFAGLRKESDAVTAVAWELTASSLSTAGGFGLSAPASAGTNKFQATSRGNLTGTAVTTNVAYNAPISAVVTCLGDIAGDSVILRINGAQVAADTTSDQGTGNYANATFNVGRRNGAANPFTGRIYQLIGRGTASDAATVASVEKFIGAKQGIAL